MATIATEMDDRPLALQKQVTTELIKGQVVGLFDTSEEMAKGKAVKFVTMAMLFQAMAEAALAQLRLAFLEAEEEQRQQTHEALYEVMRREQVQKIEMMETVQVGMDEAMGELQKQGGHELEALLQLQILETPSEGIPGELEVKNEMTEELLQVMDVTTTELLKQGGFEMGEPQQLLILDPKFEEMEESLTLQPPTEMTVGVLLEMGAIAIEQSKLGGNDQEVPQQLRIVVQKYEVMERDSILFQLTETTEEQPLEMDVTITE